MIGAWRRRRREKADARRRAEREAAGRCIVFNGGGARRTFRRAHDRFERAATSQVRRRWRDLMHAVAVLRPISLGRGYTATRMVFRDP